MYNRACVGKRLHIKTFGGRDYAWNMSSSRYWPPTSPEDLKARAEEASVHLPQACVSNTFVETGIEMVD